MGKHINNKKSSVRKVMKSVYKIDLQRYNELFRKIETIEATVEEAEELKVMIIKMFNIRTHQKCSLDKRNEILGKIETYIFMLNNF